MATVTTESKFSFKKFPVQVLNGEDTATETSLTTSTNTAEWVMNGSFTYDFTLQDAMTSGLITGAEYSAKGVTQFTISGLNHDAVTIRDTLTSKETIFQYLLNGDDIINGSSGNDILYGYAGNDILNGGAGNDQALGGAGDDTYYIAVKGDKVTEKTDEGYDIVYSEVSHKLGLHVEELYLVGSATDGTGNDLGNVLQGSSSATKTMLNGGKGDDTIYSTGHNDLLVGAAGNDTFIAAVSSGDQGAHFSKSTLSKADTIIKDFTDGQDRIDLSVFNTAFTITNHDDEDGIPYVEGELGVFDVGSGILIIGDAVGGSYAEVRIFLSGVHNVETITAADFINTFSLV